MCAKYRIAKVFGLQKIHYNNYICFVLFQCETPPAYFGDSIIRHGAIIIRIFTAPMPLFMRFVEKDEDKNILSYWATYSHIRISNLIDTERRTKSSAIIYSIIETAKTNGLKVYDYVEHLLTEIPGHEDDTDLSFLDGLLP